MLDLPSTIVVSSNYGPLQAGLQFDLSPGYSVLVGENNSGKSALLQYLFILSQRNDLNDRAAIILSNRSILPTQLTPPMDLRTWNQEFSNNYRDQPKIFHGNTGPSTEQLQAILMHGSLVAQLNDFTALLDGIGFPQYEVVGMQQQNVQGRPVSNHGSGLRAIFPILAAITNPRLELILIDEPEFAVEARVQKKLRDLFLETASRGKNIVVSTHSDLFANRNAHDHNYKVCRGAGSDISVHRIQEEQEMLDLSFDLLGNSISDLYFPENFLIVEGASDQVIVDAVRELLGVSSSAVKVLSATSITRMEGIEEALRVAMRPLIAGFSPYSGRAVCLIDKPRESSEIVDRLRRTLGDRLFELDHPSLEEYLPSEVYAAAGRAKDEDLREIEVARSRKDRIQEQKLKAKISNAIASALKVEHLRFIPEIVSAVRCAAESPPPIPATEGTPGFVAKQLG